MPDMELYLADKMRNQLSKTDETERARFDTLLGVLKKYRSLFEREIVLDFGASRGLSMVALLALGAKEVVGVEPSLSRVLAGRKHIESLYGYSGRLNLQHVEDTAALTFWNESFSFILANAVLEHIPAPRDQYLREIWRVLKVGGHLLLNETPNKYFPKEMHTTGLWFNHWLPSNMAHARAVRKKKFSADRIDWASSGWRGLGYFEIIRSLGKCVLIPEEEHSRHRFFSKLGIPASIIDPYPTWVFKKIESNQTFNPFRVRNCLREKTY